MVEQHGLDPPDGHEKQYVLEAEVQQWRLKWQKADVCPETPHATLQGASILSGMFLNVVAALRIFCTLPITTCECERSVSVLWRLKTFLSSTTGQDRLSSLTLMHVHYSRSVSIDQVLDLVASRNPRRMALIDILAAQDTAA
eukprot:scpid89150/ scgid7258/ 52 kDa repressor of the inhibitor of the protein kinase; 58 kDa interferon-induced protein kinase-interacting protein; THAP domain-containing protein 0